MTAHIYDHLDDPIDLQALADVACLSPHHWHRIYHALYGETVAATVKRLRLQRAAGELAGTALPIGAIAIRAGYDAVPSFTRAFKAVFGLPPGRYRQVGSHARFAPIPEDEPGPGYEVALIEAPPLRLATMSHAGPYLQIGRAFDALFGVLGARNLIAPGMRLIGLYLDDPSAVPEVELRSRAGVAVAADFPIEPPLEPATVAGGPYAVLRHRGPYPDMKPAYRWLYGEWLVRSGREADDRPVFEEYLNSPRDTPPTELRTDIHLPLRPA